MVKRMPEKISVKISKDLFDMIKEQVEISGGAFNSVEEYIEFILSEVIKEEKTVSEYTSEEEEMIKERLRKLGYI